MARPLGYKVTKETKKKISLARIGMKFTSAHKEKLALAKTGLFGDKANRWKGNNVSYIAKHRWINQRFGKANKCENKNCLHKSKTYEWANISKKYLRDRIDYIQLCKICHWYFDERGIKPCTL